MANVIAWPPFGITGWELAEVYPQSRSEGLIQGKARTSSAKRGRRVATATVAGIGPQEAGAGYVRMLNRLWGGKPQLVRVECLPSLWFLANTTNLQNSILEWTAGGNEMLWTAAEGELLWGTGQYSTSGTPVTIDGWNGLTVEGLPPNRIITRPSELVSVENTATKEEGYALRVTRSDANGTANILTDREEAFTVSGLVSIGAPENLVFEAIDVPRAVQGLSGDFGFTWEFREVFEDEYIDGWTEVNPW